MMYTAKGQLDRDALLRQHVPLVRRIAHHMIAKLPPNVELDDLIQVGMIGLAEALSRYEAAQGVQFETFATQLGMSLEDYQSLLGKVRGTQLVYLEDMHHDDGDEGFLDRHVADAGADPLAMLRDQRLRDALVRAIQALPEREQHIMGMYYEHDMNLKEIAAVLGVTESRICQLHSQAIARLRTKMRGH